MNGSGDSDGDDGDGSSDGGSDDGGSDDGGNGNDSPEVEQYITITDIEWVSYYLRFNVENVSDTDIEFLQVDSTVYEGDTRIGTMYTNIGDLAAGTNVNGEIDYTTADVDGSLCDGTRYTISPSVGVGSDQYGHTYEYADDVTICGE